MPKTTKRSPAQRAAWSKLSPWMKRKIRKSPLSVWARRIRREYGAQCAWCSKKRSLEAHHFLPKHQFPEYQEDLSVGVLLCLKCHDKIHALLLQNVIQYIEMYEILNAKRKPIKSVKNRNPGGFTIDKLYLLK